MGVGVVLFFCILLCNSLNFMLGVGAKLGMNKCISNLHLASNVCLFSYRRTKYLA